MKRTLIQRQAKNKYHSIPDYLKEQNLIIPFTNVKIPLPHVVREIWGMGQVFGQAATGAYRTRGELKDAALGSVASVVNSLNIFGGNFGSTFIPTVFRGPWEAGVTGKDWLGRDIRREPRGKDKELPAWRNTNERKLTMPWVSIPLSQIASYGSGGNL